MNFKHGELTELTRGQGKPILIEKNKYRVASDEVFDFIMKHKDCLKFGYHGAKNIKSILSDKFIKNSFNRFV